MLKCAAALLAAVSAVTANAQPATGLRIAVLAGEDAVNIIQQQTAVAPLVEVRDRNNQPVAGAIVTFSIEGGKAASFGGASTLTVATNAAGQAAVTGLTPSAAGAFQIQVSAAFQGQVASATIAQTNVMTAAQAAAASAASGGGGSAGGGGLSTTTLAVAGAAVAGGAVAATQVAKKDEDGGSGAFTGALTGTMSTTVIGRNSGQTCTITKAISGTATFRARSNDPNNVAGDIDLNGTANVTAATCTLANQSNPIGGTIAVSGTQSALRGSASSSSTSSGVSGEVITGTQTLLFDGAMSGNSVTGTLKFEIKAVSTGGGGGPVDSLETGTFSLTLTKS